MASPLVGTPFDTYTLTYQTATESAGTDPVTGEPIPGEPESGEVTALVSVDRAAQLQLLPGADQKLVRLTVELLSPTASPVGVGATLSLTFAGKTGTFTVTSLEPNDLTAVDFGDVLRGEFRYG